MLAVALTGAAHAQTPTDTARLLATIDSTYRAMSGHPDIHTLVMLDGQLRALAPEDPEAPRMSARFVTPHLEPLGLSRSHFDPEFVTYSGRLLAEAHQLDPQSKWREYTLYASLAQPDSLQSPLPNTLAAAAYVKEFPRGHFAADAYLALAHVSDDLFKVLRDSLAGQTVDYKYDCYKSRITRAPPAEQMRAAQAAGIRYYQLSLALQPNSSVDDALADLRGGKGEQWYTCPD